MTLKKESFSILGALLLGAYLAAAGWGAEAKPRQGAEQTQVSDRDLKAFAKAYVEYHRIRQNYEPRLNATKNESDKQKLRREGDDKVKQALERQGLTPQSYNRLFAAINNNPQLREKALSLISEERSGKS
jgi:hypothetical protein